MQQVDDPPFLSVGTEVSAKYKGAFCEAKVRKVVRNIKCKVAYKQGLGSGTVSDELIKGVLRVGATVEVKHPDRRDYVEATITKIQDCSQYTVVFDDGDITTLRRTALCLKSGRHFNESETLDQLPLTHPEHFGNPVIGGRRGRRHLQDDSSDDDDDNDSKEVVNEKEEHIGKVVCVESTETKKKDKEKWFPALVVSPTAQVTVRIRVKDEYLVRSFKDGRYYTVPKKEATEFTRDMASKQDGAAVQAALQYLDNSTLPPHWDKDALFGLANSSSEYEGEFDSDSSDDEPREEKDLFVAQLYKYMDDRGTPLNKVPSITNKDVDLYRLFRAVQKLGGYNRVTSQNQWKAITTRLGFLPVTVSVTNLVKQAYKKFLQPFEEFNRKLGCSMSMTPRNANRSKGRSLVRANSVASPKPEPKEPKASTSTAAPAVSDDLESESSNDVAKSKRKLSTSSGKVKAMVDKLEEKVKEEQAEATSAKLSKSSSKEEQASSSTTVSTTTTGSAKKEGKKKAAAAAAVPSQDEKKPNRKRKETQTGDSEKSASAESATDKDKEKEFPIEVGDKLSVYYHEKKVTYEAKVIETSMQQGVPFYLVHYTGWNTRYDEWVPRERIAENLTANKAKKGKTTSSNQKAASNVPPNDGTKGTAANVDKLASAMAAISTPSAKNSSATKRGRGRSDSGPPRSITPSSMASSSSRTKSPAASIRRTTRGQPSTSRRESNNVSDISMQTDSDSDSDTPVKKPTKASAATTTAATPSPSAPTPKSTAAGKPSAAPPSNSPSDSDDEEEMPTCSAKARDYDLNQIRSELKGFKELKSPSPESESNTQTTDGDKKPGNVFDFDLSEDLGKKSSTESKTSSTDMSSETDSFGDDDSQSSDKTTMLENMTEKFQQKIAHDKRLERMNSGGSDKISAKTASIEKIIEDTLAEKKQESLKSKPFAMEKSLFKPVEVEVKPEPAPVEMKPPIRDRKLLKPSTLSVDKKLSDPVPTEVESTSIAKFEKKLAPPTVVDSIITPVKKEPPMMAKKELLALKKEVSAPAEPAPASVEIPLKEVPVVYSQPDIYEFKEPEPFEFETRKGVLAANLTSPDSEKKGKKPVSKPPTEVTPDKQPPPPTTPASGKKNKKSPVKDAEKAKVAKIEEKLPAMSIIEPVGLLTPSKIENTFDALRKSPSFNLNINATNEEGAHLFSSQEPPKLFSEQLEKSPPLIASSSGDSTKKVTHISPFVETSKDSPKSFDLKHDVSAIESPDKVAKALELEQVKRILALDPVLPFEPPKVVDKGKFSIADKVLQKLNQKKHEDKEPEDELVPKQEEAPPAQQPPVDPQPAPVSTPTTSQQALCPPVIEAPQINTFPLIEPPKIELPAIIKKEIEIPVKKPILSSPEPKLDILESITPKNAVLSETIQKLESVIRKRTEVDHFDEDSADSTDSERRLVIEDDSHSSETNQTDFGYDTEVAKKQPNIFAEENLFSSSRDSGSFKMSSPSAFTIQTSSVSSSSHPPVDEKPPDLLSSTEFKPIDAQPHVPMKVDKLLPELHIQTSLATPSPASFAVKKEELSPSQDTSSSITHNEAINLLLCEETIPGSPAPPKEPSDIKPNVHPIDSDIKHIPMDIECSIQPTADVMGGIGSHSVGMGSSGDGGSDKVKAESNTPTSSPRDSLSQDESSEELRKMHGPDSMASPKKRRITRKHSDAGEQMSKRRRHNVAKRTNAGSDSDDNSDANNSQLSSNRSSRPCQYNFLVDLDPTMSPNQRIMLLNKTISELRKTYNSIKAELASIDRRRKKIRRREREKKLQQKVHC